MPRSGRQVKPVELLYSLKDDSYINVHRKNNLAFRMAGKYNYTLLSLEGDRKINLTGLNYDNETRLIILKIMMKNIFRKRKKSLIRRKSQKIKDWC